MANKYDARPFTDLQKDAQEFEAKFEEDIEKCKIVLDSKITSLICDPDSLGKSVALKQNALVEFSKAKYEIYISMKSLINDMEREWHKYLSEMKKLFIDNVEVFLANTKLEVKLPSAGSLLSPGPRKSLGSKTSAVTNTIYPILSSITKSIPVLSAENGISEDEDVDMEKSPSRYDSAKHWKSPSSALNRMSPKDSSSSESQEETNKNESELVAVNSRKSNNRSSRSRERISNSDESEEVMETVTSNRKNKVPLKVTNRKQASKRQANTKTTLEERTSSADESENVMATVTSSKKIMSLKSSKRSQSSRRQANIKTTLEERTDSADESDNIMETVTSNKKNNVSLKSSKRNQSMKRQANVKTNLEERTNSSDESEEVMETTTSNNKSSTSLKASKRNQASKRQAKVVEEKIDPDSECDEDLSKTSKPRGRPSRRKTMHEMVKDRAQRTHTAEQDIADMYDMETSVAQPSRSTRRKTLLPNVKDIEMDMEASIAQPLRSATRRKTLLPNVKDTELGSDIIPGYSTTAKSKRKTLMGVSDFASVTPSKRLKISNNTESERAVIEDGLLEMSDCYSEWISLNSVDGKIPTSPGIYELKVWRAKKCAYIGNCDSLRQKLTVHKLKHNSGHKHLDKFIERNYDDIQVRYQVVQNVNVAKLEVKNRVNNFVALHKTTPAYN